MKDKMISTNEVGPRFQEIAHDAPTPGPMMGVEISPLDFIARNATPDELKAFERTIRERKAREPKEVFEKCGACGFVLSRPNRPRASSACIKCNWAQIEGGGMMRPMTEKEIGVHLEAQAKKDAAWAERMERAAFNRRNDDRRKHGLLPLSLEAFRGEMKAEAESRAKERQELMNLARKLAGSLAR